MRGIADANGFTVAQVAIAWLLHQPAVTSVLIGAKRLDQLADNIAASKVKLSRRISPPSTRRARCRRSIRDWMLDRQGGARRQQLAGKPK